MATVDKQDVQGFILKGYGRLKETRYYLLKVNNAALGKKWLDTISNVITDGNHKPLKTCLNIAFSHAGLAALGMNKKNLRAFSREFREGMDTDHRNRLLGDLGTSGSENWILGGNRQKAKDLNASDADIHIMLMAFGANEGVLAEFCSEIEAGLEKHELSVVVPLEGKLLEDNKIHIGFRDGISQPVVKGTGKTAHENNMVETGEFLMGYKNEYGVYPDAPLIDNEQGDVNLLPMDIEGTGLRNLGHNGSYLVYRKMEEEVDVFWKYMNENTKKEDGSLDEEESIKLASKMIGRWPNGSPIVKYPEAMPSGISNDNDFGYHADDKEGQKCPFGSHMRRNNPRDSFEDNSARHSLKLSKKHRIIRRGRSYGEPLISTPTNHKPEGKIGLHFMCFNADIAGQFEFIQHTWSNFPRFENLYNDPDPITGVLDLGKDTPVQNFTIQAQPVNKCVKDLSQFVTVKGGVYLFFPSISAIKYISTI